MKISSFFLFFMLLNTSLIAQLPECDATALITEDNANLIAQKLNNIYGGGSCPTVFYDTGGSIATLGKDYRIRVSWETIKILKEFGCAADDCLAIILAHELRHFHQRETGVSYGSNASLSELDADLFGLLVAHLAGYSAGIKNYDAMLIALKLRDSKVHSDLQQRIQNDNIIKKRLNEIIPLYQAGIYNLLIGGTTELNRAAACFKMANANLEQGNDKFEFPQFNYQLGLVYFLKALGEYGGSEKWVFPLETLDASSFRGNTQGNQEQMLLLLDSAEIYFKKNIMINNMDWNAQLGLANAKVLRIANNNQTLSNVNLFVNALLTDVKNEIVQYSAQIENDKNNNNEPPKWKLYYIRNLREIRDKTVLLQYLSKLLVDPYDTAIKLELQKLGQETSFIEVKGLVSANIALFDGVSISQSNTLELDEVDGLNISNWKQIYDTFKTQKGNYKSNIGKNQLLILQPLEYKGSQLMLYGVDKSNAYLFQEYNTCPLDAETVDRAGGGTSQTGTGDFRFFRNKDYSVIIEMSPNGKNVERCVKVFY